MAVRGFFVCMCVFLEIWGGKMTYFYSLNHFNWGRILARYLRTLFSSQTIAKIGGDTLVSCLFSPWTIPVFICSEVSKPFNHKQILHRGSPNEPQQLREPVYIYCTCRTETDKSTWIYTTSLSSTMPLCSQVTVAWGITVCGHLPVASSAAQLTSWPSWSLCLSPEWDLELSALWLNVGHRDRICQT